MKITRRFFAFLLITCAPVVLFSFSHVPNKVAEKGQYVGYIGTYTSKTASKGIYAYRFDTTTGRLSAMGVTAESTDPSFLVTSSNGKYLYAVNETDNFQGEKSGAVSAYSMDRKSGKLTLLNQVASRGAGPCYISLDKTGKYVLIANYDGGSVASFSILEDGRLGTASTLVKHSGQGPNKERQDGPHAHWIETSPDNRLALAVDLGLDEVLVYRFAAASGALTPNDPAFAKGDAGAGPRHLGFHPNGRFAYVLNEIQSTVTALTFDPQTGALSSFQTLSTLRKNFPAPTNTRALGVHPSGKYLYASNRGHDSIALFAIDPTNGTLTPTGTFSTRGKMPRHFAIDPTGNFLLAANQESNNIVVFRINRADGSLSAVGEPPEVPAPVCIVFAPAD